MSISSLVKEASRLNDEINQLQIKHATAERTLAAVLGVDQAKVLNDQLVFVNELLPGMVDGSVANYGSRKMKQHSMTVDGVEIYFKEVIE